MVCRYPIWDGNCIHIQDRPYIGAIILTWFIPLLLFALYVFFVFMFVFVYYRVKRCIERSKKEERHLI